MRVVLVAISIVVAACGGSGGESSAGSQLPDSLQAEDELDAAYEANLEEAERVTMFVEETLGPDDGLRAVLAAWERGYGREQFLSLGIDGLKLERNGVLVRSGEVVEPSEARRGVIALPAAMSGLHGLRSWSDPVDLESVAAGLEDCRYQLHRTSVFKDGSGTYTDDVEPLPGGATEALIAALFYGVGQDGIEAMIAAAKLGLCVEFKVLTVLGAEEQRLETLYIEDSCKYLVIDGEVFLAGESSYPDCRGWVFEEEGLLGDDGESESGSAAAVPDPTTEEGTSVSPEEEARVYRGSVVITLVYADLDGFDPLWPTSQCETVVDAELTIRPDGTASLVVDWVEFVSAPGSGAFTQLEDGCVPAFGATAGRAVEGTWEDGFFSIGITEPYGRSISRFDGDFQDTFAAAAGSLTLESGPSGQLITGEFSFNLPRVTD